jgi:hypothetical protein
MRAFETLKVEENESKDQKQNEGGRIRRVDFEALKDCIENLMKKEMRENFFKDGNFLFIVYFFLYFRLYGRYFLSHGTWGNVRRGYVLR